MPELPEVETVVRGLRECIVGKSVAGIREIYPGTIRNHAHQCIPYFGIIDYVDRRGKYILLHTDRGFNIVIHLRMTGKLVVKNDEGDTHIRAIFDFADHSIMAFSDVRTFGKIDIYPANEPMPMLDKLGIEPLSYGFDASYLKEKWHHKKAPVKNLLLQQDVIAGLGNIYACEALYRSGIHPLKQGGKLSTGQRTRLVNEIRAVLIEAIDNNGTSVSDFRRVDDKTGEFQAFLTVYQKKTCPQGHEVQRIVTAGRSTFFCPICQRLK